MPEATPHLSPVDSDSATEEPTAEATPVAAEAPPEKPRSSRLAWFLAIGMLVFATWLVYETSQLQTRNAALSAELTATRAQLDAYQAHLDGARERAAGLRGQLEEFEAFLASEPGAAR